MPSARSTGFALYMWSTGPSRISWWAELPGSSGGTTLGEPPPHALLRPRHRLQAELSSALRLGVELSKVQLAWARLVDCVCVAPGSSPEEEEVGPAAAD